MSVRLFRWSALAAGFVLLPGLLHAQERQITITTKGLGDTMPAAPNTTAEGRVQNRRVEVMKL